MAFSVKKGTITAHTSTGSQGYTGVGFTPKAIAFWGTNQTATGYLGNVRVFYGAATRQGGSTQQWCQAISADDTLGTSDTGRGNNNAACIHAHNDATTPTVEMVADLTSFDADGFTLNWSIAAGSAWIIHYLALGGSDITNAYAGNVLTTATTSNQAITAPGFTPEALWGVCNLQGAWNQDISQGNICMGFATPAARGTTAWRSRDAQANEDGAGSQITTQWLSGIASTAGTAAPVIEVASWDANGFTIQDDFGVAMAVGYLAIAGGQHFVGSETSRTSTGTKATTGVGFEPTGVAMMSWGLAASASIDTSSDVNLAFGASDETSEGYTGISLDDGNTTMAVDMRTVDTKVIGAQDVTPATIREADLDSFDADGFTLNWTTADATAAQFIYWAMGSDPAAPGGVRMLATTGVGK